MLHLGYRPVGREQEYGTVTKQEILEAAAQIFSEKGFHATSMQDIADAVNLKKASLYHHIDSKQKVLLEILDQALDIVIAEVKQATEGGYPTPDKIRRAIRTYLNTLTVRKEIAAVLLLEYRALDGKLFNQHIVRRDRFERLWRNLIQAGVDEGAFVCSDPSQAGRALLGMMNWTITWYSPTGRLTAEQIADQYTDLLLTGLLEREA